MKKKARQTIQTDYLEKAFKVDQFTKAVDKAAKALRAFHKKHPFDAIAFTGNSGAAFAFPLSYKLKLPLICVRKRLSDSHSSHQIEGCVSARRYVIVDDFIESGSTMRRIQKHVKKEMDAELIGIYLYRPTCACRKWHNIPII